jgi:hypothetical protein
MTVKIHAAPPVRLAHPSVSHRRAADSRCTVVNPLPGAALGAEKRQATPSSTLGDKRGFTAERQVRDHRTGQNS